MEQVLDDKAQYLPCQDLVKVQFKRLRDMFYRLAAGECGNPAYPRISLTKLVELLAKHGQNTLKTVMINPEVTEAPSKASEKISKLLKKKTLAQTEKEAMPVEVVDPSLT